MSSRSSSGNPVIDLQTMDQNEKRPKLIIFKRRSDHMSENSSIGETCFKEQFERYNRVKSKSEYSLNTETDETNEIWAPILGSTVSLEFDCDSNCSSCNDLLSEIKLHKYFKTGGYYGPFPSALKRTQSLPNLNTKSSNPLFGKQSNSSSLSSIFSIHSE